MSRDLNILALAKGDHRYIFLYDDASRPALIRVLHKFAADPRLNLSRADAKMLSERAGLLPQALWERLQLTCGPDGLLS